ncbi:hypothetical protein L1987_38396 [Smallanthus sonchifolius]|uniref:Uncharacterized protein n=1 Tax=Smallanthus sonchifolius TaxID=185202 RepID=A0ACB9HJ34_9ASTR|nr:hypothetical protein L1987_38396 [Smallanthus sonchifolius]
MLVFLPPRLPLRLSDLAKKLSNMREESNKELDRPEFEIKFPKWSHKLKQKQEFFIISPSSPFSFLFQIQRRFSLEFNHKLSMSQQQQRSHIPKFGSWDADNVPYTAYFENARKDKGTGVMINPNDPEQNPEAFMKYGGNDDIVNDIMFDDTNMKSDKSSNSNSKQSYKPDRKKSSNSRERTSNFSPPSPSSAPAPNRPRYGYNPADDIASHRSASVPMFGAWDDKDPKSAEGFTVIFQKVKEEKHIAATNFPPIPQQSTYNHNAPKKDTNRVKV